MPTSGARSIAEMPDLTRREGLPKFRAIQSARHTRREGVVGPPDRPIEAHESRDHRPARHGRPAAGILRSLPGNAAR
jgi:hypothetical protein